MFFLCSNRIAKTQKNQYFYFVFILSLSCIIDTLLGAKTMAFKNDILITLCQSQFYPCVNIQKAIFEYFTGSAVRYCTRLNFINSGASIVHRYKRNFQQSRECE